MRPLSLIATFCALCACTCVAEPDPANADDTGASDGGAASSEEGPAGSTGSAETGAADESTGGATEVPPGDRFLDGFFPIGVFGQPAENFETWVDRGCNTMFEVPQEHDAGAWDQEAQRLGLRVIRPPLGGGGADIGRTDLLAWSLPDEPDIDANQSTCGGNCIELCEFLASEYAAIDPERPVFVNLAGPNVLLESACDFCNGPGDEPGTASCFPDNAQCYPRILETADWISQDIYPVTGWLPNEALREDVTVPGQTLDKLASWTDKPLMAIIELSDQRLGFAGTGTRAPSAAEVRAEIWNAIIHGARGIFYFPQAFDPFEWDAAPSEVIAELEVQHQTITALSDVLQREIDPDGFGVDVPWPLEASWRQSGDEIYVFMLNTSPQVLDGAPIAFDTAAADTKVYDEDRDLSIADGAFNDDFPPFGVHIYVLGGD
ncbi:MAG: hypothetical protein AAF721_07465 [Myxococcota bacterium]